MIDLGHLGGEYSIATDINDFGQVVGHSFTSTGETHAFIWSRGVMRDLGGSPAGDVFADSINAFGQIVGYGLLDGFHWNALRWRGGIATSITPVGVDGYAYDINILGQVAGDNAGLAALWSPAVASGGDR
jgi:probable HAF family extracellular repeat protein